MGKIQIVNAVAWWIWFVTLLIVHWGEVSYWKPMGFCVIGIIPFMIIAWKFWGPQG